MQAYLSDRMLLVGVMCITLPAVIVLVVWSSLSFHITKDVLQNEVGEFVHFLYSLVYHIIIAVQACTIPTCMLLYESLMHCVTGLLSPLSLHVMYQLQGQKKKKRKGF